MIERIDVVFDANGNQRTVLTPAGDVTTYAWTYENQLRTVELPDGSVTTYTYAPVIKSADEFRVETETDAGVTRHFWDRHNIVWETDDVGTLEAEYTVNPQPYGNLVSQRRDGESSSYQFDGLRSTRQLLDDTQTVTGNRTTNTWTYENRLALTVQPNGTRITQTWAPVTRSGDEYRVVQQAFSVYFKHFCDRDNIVREPDDFRWRRSTRTSRSRTGSC